MKISSISKFLETRLPELRFAADRRGLPYAPTDEHIHEELYQLTLGQGDGVVTVGHRSFEVAPSRFFIANPRELHGLSDRRGGTFANLSCRFLLPGFPGPLLATKVELDEANAERGLELFARLTAEFAADTRPGRIRASLALAELLLLLEEHGHAAPHAANSRPVEEALEFMRANFKNGISVEEVARAAAVTPEHLSRSFHRETGNKPLEYLQRLRLGYALDRLFSSRRKLGEIAAEVGFSNLKTFNAAFQKRYRCSPGQFRKAHIEEQPKDK